MKNKDNEIFSIPIERIKKVLSVKKVKGKEYYYLKIKMKGKPKEFYVCPVSCSDSQLRYNFCLVRKEIVLEFFILYFLSIEKYPLKYLTTKERLLLEFIRLGYNILLKEFGDSDIKRYEEAVYTKYVYGTTSIEGNTYTLRETDLTLNEGLTVSGKERREFYEIENYSKMKKYLDSKKKIKIDISFIKLIHKFILTNIDDDSAGEFRKVDVGIRGTEFEPVPAVTVEDEMRKLVEWYNKNKNKMHPIELITLFHQRFEEIHPFKDGNGRVGRELVRVILKMYDYPTIFIDMRNREEYLKSLDEGNKGDHRRLCKFLAGNLISIHEKLLKRAESQLKRDIKEFRYFCSKCYKKKVCDDMTKKKLNKIAKIMKVPLNKPKKISEKRND